MSEIEAEIFRRTLIARELLAQKITEADLALHPVLSLLPSQLSLTRDLGINYPDQTLAPKPQTPDTQTVTTDSLPRADVLVVTWTVDEQDGLADVLTPGIGRAKWTRYNRNFASRYADQIRPGAPSLAAGRLGSWCLTKIGATSALCFKSELHLNQDGIRDAVAPGVATLPVKDMFRQLIEEVKPKLVITVGTSGGLYLNHDEGDVAVTRAAKFRLKSEFKNADFNRQVYRSDWKIPTEHFPAAQTLMNQFANKLVEPPIYPPTARHEGAPFTSPVWAPRIRQDGMDGIPAFHPILTTDYFEFGTSTNNLDQEGLAVEMGDAVLGLVVEEMKNQGLAVPNWVVVRNLSDPQINGQLDHDLQIDWAVWYYKKYGYWTSVMSALVSWAIIAGLSH